MLAPHSPCLPPRCSAQARRVPPASANARAASPPTVPIISSVFFARPPPPGSLQRPPTASPAAATATPEKPDYLNKAESVIWDSFVAEFAPVELVVQDISDGCGSMYGIEISSDKFRGLGMLKQQRLVNYVLADLMKGWYGV